MSFGAVCSCPADEIEIGIFFRIAPLTKHSTQSPDFVIEKLGTRAFAPAVGGNHMDLLDLIVAPVCRNLDFGVSFAHLSRENAIFTSYCAFMQGGFCYKISPVLGSALTRLRGL